MINHELTQHETSRRDLLAGIGMLGGLAALAACGKKASASRPPEIRPTTPTPTQTPETTPTTQSTWTSTGEPTPTPTPTRSEVTSRLEQTFTVDKASFANWENKTSEEKMKAGTEWFKSNGYTEPMPSYRTGAESHHDVSKLIDWWFENRYIPVWQFHKQEPELAMHLAEDVIAADRGVYNRIADSMNIDHPLNETYLPLESTDIKIYTTIATGENHLGFVAILQNRVYSIDNLMLDSTITKDSDAKDTIRVYRSGSNNNWRTEGSGLTYYSISDDE